jgi:hypothetical protein
MRTALAQADVVERLTQKPKPRLELFVQKIAAGFKPGTVGLAKSVSPLAAAVPVPFWSTKDSQVRGSVPCGGSPYTFQTKGTAKEFVLWTFQTRLTDGASEHWEVKTRFATGVGVGVGVLVGVRVAVGVAVMEGVLVGVAVFEGVRVGVGVGVIDGVRVGVGVFDGVRVGVGVFVGAACADAARKTRRRARATLPDMREILARIESVVTESSLCPRRGARPGTDCNFWKLTSQHTPRATNPSLVFRDGFAYALPAEGLRNGH